MIYLQFATSASALIVFSKFAILKLGMVCHFSDSIAPSNILLTKSPAAIFL